MIYDPRNHIQRYHSSHSRSIVALCCDSSRKFIASGEAGRDACVHVWESWSGRTLMKSNAIIPAGVASLTFDIQGKRLLAISADPFHTLFIWRTASGTWTVDYLPLSRKKRKKKSTIYFSSPPLLTKVSFLLLQLSFKQFLLLKKQAPLLLYIKSCKNSIFFFIYCKVVLIDLWGGGLIHLN